MKRYLPTILLALALPAQAAAPPPDSPIPPDSEMQRLLDDRVATYRDTVGLVVGIVTPQGRKVFARGTYDVGDDLPVDGNTIFDIGGVSKLFTALLLTEMARKGEVALSDPVAKYLPAGTKLPQSAKPITLLDLATHRSGLPRQASNVLITDLNHPNKTLTVEQLYRFLASYEMPKPPGTTYEYSNLGYQLLGLALAGRGHADFEPLLRAMVLDPMHLASTRFTISDEMKARVTIGHDGHLLAVNPTPPPTLLGADSLYSSVNDLTELVAAVLGQAKNPLQQSLADTLKVRLPTDIPTRQVALAWHVATVHGIEIAWLNSEANGYRSFVGFAPDKHVGVVLLSNSLNPIDDLAVHLLDPQTPLRTLHREVKANPAQYDDFVGQYAVNENFVVTISRDQNRLFIQPFGQPRTELFPESDLKFFLREPDAEVTFQTDDSGYAHSLVLAQGGEIKSAKRIR